MCRPSAPARRWSPSLTPTKAVQDKVSQLNGRLAAVAGRHPAIFVHPVPTQRDGSQFLSASTACVQHFGTCGDVAQDLGAPFATMVAGKQPGGFCVDKEKLARLQANIRELADAL